MSEIVKAKTDVVVTIEHINGSDRQVADAARTTINLAAGDKEITPAYMRKMYMCEHSPIRIKEFNILIENIPYWVAMHFVRHHVGVTPFVSTQRTDRTNTSKRGEQDAPVMLRMVANAQAIMAMSRKRLCLCASKETRAIWIKVLNAIKEYDEALYKCCVPECVYRGFCPEFYDCSDKGTKVRYCDTQAYQIALEEYRDFK